MPRIQTETVAEHRQLRETEIVAAARSILLEFGPKGVTPGAVASAVGLSRTAIYKYFTSGEDLLERIIDDSFAEWSEAVKRAVEEASDIGSKIDAYVITSLSLGVNGTHHIAELAGGLLSEDRTRLAERHRELTAPLTSVLEQCSVQHPAIVADLIDGILGRAITQIDAGAPSALITDTTLSLIHRALPIDSSDKASRRQE